MSLRIDRIPTLGDNYTYLLVCEASGEAAVVDAPEAEPVIRQVDACGARVTKVSDAERIPGFTDGLEEGDTIRVGQEEARILFIPAHTSGHIAYVFDAAEAVFCGDTLFAGGCGRLFEGDARMMFEAMRKLGALPDATRVFCGHEYTESNLIFAAHVEPDNAAVATKLEQVRKIRAGAAADWHDATPAEMTIPTTIGEERAINPFLRAADADQLGERRAAKDSF